MFSLPRTAFAFPFRPAPSMRLLHEVGALLRFAASFALLISVLAGVRAGLLADGWFSVPRFASSLFGFVVFPLLLWLAGRPLGGRGAVRALAAATVGCAVPFIAVDLLWIVVLAAGGASDAFVPTVLERLSWVWALVVLVAAVAAAQRF